MPISLDNALIPQWLQVLRAGHGWIDKAEASAIPEHDLIDARLIDDMLPFCYQVKSMALHSLGAVEGARRGSFSPDFTDPPQTLAGLRARIDDAIAGLLAVEDGALDAIAGKDIVFEVPGRAMRLDFTVADFLTSFSLPNFYFHASTAYGILRMKGIDVGKRDFLGRLRLKGEAGA